MKSLPSRLLSALLPTLLVFAASAPPAEAQTGPFKDGELLVWTDDAVSGRATLYRIDAVTGQGAPLMTDLLTSYLLPSGFVYDSFRDAVLTYASWEPTGLFLPRLFRVTSDGTVTDMGFNDEKLSSFTPVGDGRVYMRKNGQLHLFDASDQLVPVLDAANQPITLELEHMVFDPGLNALIGAAPFYSTNACSSFNTITVHKLPLDSSGTKLSGPSSCTAFSAIAALNPLGLDPLPGGRLLLTLAGGQFSSDKVLLSVDPVAMTLSTEVSTSFADLNGGVWCQRIGRSVVLDDVANELRTYLPGESGSGTLLPVDVPVGDQTTGVSALNTLTDIDLGGPACAGLAFAFGQGLAGTGGFTPSLSANSCPAIGATVQLFVRDGVGGGVGVLIAGQSTFAYNVLGGTGYVLPPFELQLLVNLGGTPGVGGAGDGAVPVATPNDPSLLGIPFYFQAGVLDPGAPVNVSLTQALEIRLG